MEQREVVTGGLFVAGGECAEAFGGDGRHSSTRKRLRVQLAEGVDGGLFCDGDAGK